MSQSKRSSDSKGKGQPTKPAKNASKPNDKRASFVLRLNLDEQNQVHRCEIQHVQSNKTQSSPTLECERIIAFVESCLGPLGHPKLETEVEAESLPSRPKAHKAHPLTARLSRVDMENSSNFVIWDNPAQALQARVHFVLEGEVDLPAQYTVQIYARSVDKGGSGLVASQSNQLTPGKNQYDTTLEIEQLSLGLHQLSAVVRIASGPMGYCEGLMVQVNQLSTLPEVSINALSAS